MKPINKKAEKILTKIVDGLDSDNPHRKIDNSECFMAVSVEWIGHSDIGDHFSVAHYGTQNGDAMRDPEMIFARTWQGKFIPVYFRNDYIGREEVSVTFEDSKASAFRPRLQREHATFAGQWLPNIKSQQAL